MGCCFCFQSVIAQSPYFFKRLETKQNALEGGLNVLETSPYQYSAIFSSIWPSKPSWYVYHFRIDGNSGELIDSVYVGHNDTLSAWPGLKGSAFIDKQNKNIVIGGGGYGTPITKANPVVIKFSLLDVDSTYVLMSEVDSFNYYSQGKETVDGNYIFSGQSDIGPSKYPNMTLTKTDTNGNVLWEEFYGTAWPDYGLSVNLSTDGGYFLLGESAGYGQDLLYSSDAILIKTDSLGNEQWRSTWGGYYSDCAWNVEPLADGGAVICGCVSNNESTEQIEGYIRRIDPFGGLVWEKAFDFIHPLEGGWPNVFNMCRILPNGNIVTAGSGQIVTTDSISGREVPWLTILSPSGEVLMDRAYISIIGTHSSAVFQDIRLTQDGGFIAGGTYNPSQNDSGNQDVFILKLDERGCEYPECIPPLAVEELKAENVNVIAYPNPARDILILKSDAPIVSYSIVDAMGKNMLHPYSKPSGSSTGGSHRLEIDVRGLLPGLYFVQLNTSEGLQVLKFVRAAR